MAKTTTLKERGTGEALYPQTIPSQVIFPDGTDLNDVLESQSNVTGVPTEKRIEAIEPTLVTEALRKVPQSLTSEEQAQVKANLGISKKELFIDMWNAAAGQYGRYNEATGFFELNGLTDITYGQAIKIYDATYPARQLNDLSAAFTGMSFRTNLPVATFQKSESGLRMQSAFRFVSGVEVINLNFKQSAIQPALRIAGNPMWIFPNSKSLKKILGPITFIERAPAFNGWPSGLEDVQIYALSVDLDMQYCSRLTLASVKYIIDNAAENTKPITITVHPDVYAKLTGDTTNAAAAALTEEELAQWMQIVTDAAAKKITFITA